MKLPRWLVIGMLTLCVLAVLPVGWCWVTWPERTAREFISLCAEGRGREIKRMFGHELRDFLLNEGGRPFESAEPEPEFKDAEIKALPRTLTDCLKGRQEFVIDVAGLLGIVVERGAVVDYLEDSGDGKFISRMEAEPIVDPFPDADVVRTRTGERRRKKGP